MSGFAEDRRGSAQELSEKVARVPMCLGLAVLCGPPTVGLSSYFLFYASDTWATDLLENKYRVKVPTSASLLSYTGTGLAAATAYKLQDALVLKQLAAGGRWAYIEPKKINNWMQFWKATGPHTFGIAGAMIASVALAGACHPVCKAAANGWHTK